MHHTYKGQTRDLLSINIYIYILKDRYIISLKASV